jgi:glycosyltransferase involved in cell wall biosynthesis
VALLDPIVAGAETIALKAARALQGEFRVTLATLRSPEAIAEGLGWDGPTGEIRDLLFGCYQVLHTHLFLPGLLARLRRLWDPRIRWIHTVHYHDYQTVRFGRLKRWLDHRFVFPDADILVAVSPLVARSLEAFPRARTILNTIDTPPRHTLFTGITPVLGTVAMLRPEKGIGDLLEALSVLKEGGHEVRLRIAGDGPLRFSLQERARKLGVEDRVRFEGFLEDLEEVYRGLHLYVQPSREESFGLAALEGMARGLPLVVSDGGFLPELVGDGAWGRVARTRPGESRGQALARTILGALGELEELGKAAQEGWEAWEEQVRPGRMEREYRDAVKKALLPRITMIQPIVTHATGGLQRQLRIQTRELAALGHRITLVQRRDRTLIRDPERGIAWSHVEILHIPDPTWLPTRLRGAWFMTAALVRLVLRRRATDVYHAHQLFSPPLVGAGAKILRGGALVAKVTAAGVLGEARQIQDLPFRNFRLRVFRALDRVLVLHQAMGREMASLGIPPAKVQVIPNSVEIPPEPVPMPSPVSPETPLSLLWVGRLSTEKGLEILLEAGKILAKEGRTVEIHLVGGPDPDRDAEPELKRLTADLGGKPNVHFHGSRSDVPDFYALGPVFVLPSRSEGMSNALLEAMAWGLPCVVSNIPANRALVEDGREGLLFRNGDPASLARVLTRLHRDLTEEGGILAQRLGEGARRRMEEGFSAESVARRLSDLYLKLTS